MLVLIWSKTALGFSAVLMWKALAPVSCWIRAVQLVSRRAEDTPKKVKTQRDRGGGCQNLKLALDGASRETKKSTSHLQRTKMGSPILGHPPQLVLSQIWKPSRRSCLFVFSALNHSINSEKNKKRQMPFSARHRTLCGFPLKRSFFPLQIGTWSMFSFPGVSTHVLFPCLLDARVVVVLALPSL